MPAGRSGSLHVSVQHRDERGSRRRVRRAREGGSSGACGRGDVATEDARRSRRAREWTKRGERRGVRREGVQQSPARRLTLRFHLHFCCATRTSERTEVCLSCSIYPLLSLFLYLSISLSLSFGPGSCGIFIDNYNAREARGSIAEVNIGVNVIAIKLLRRSKNRAARNGGRRRRNPSFSSFYFLFFFLRTI